VCHGRINVSITRHHVARLVKCREKKSGYSKSVNNKRKLSTIIKHYLFKDNSLKNLRASNLKIRFKVWHKLLLSTITPRPKEGVVVQLSQEMHH